MGYVDRNLMSGEEVVYKAKIHWFIFVPGLVLFVVGIFLFGVDKEGGVGPLIGTIAILLAIFSLIKAFTVFGNTQVRIDEKVGLICSFCGKDQSEVEKVIAGPEVYICDECVLKAYDECEKNWWDLFWISMKNKNISEKNRRALLKRAMHKVNKK